MSNEMSNEMSSEMITRDDLADLLYALQGEARRMEQDNGDRTQAHAVGRGMHYVASTVLYYVTGQAYGERRNDPRDANPESELDVRQRLDRLIFNAESVARAEAAEARLAAFLAQNPGVLDEILADVEELGAL